MPVYAPGQAAAERLRKLPGRMTADRFEKIERLRRLGHADAMQRLSPETEFMSSAEREAYLGGYQQVTKEREAAMARRASDLEKRIWQSGFRDGAAGKPGLFGSMDADLLAIYRSGYVAGVAARKERIAAGPPLTQSWGSVFVQNYPQRGSRALASGGPLGTLPDTIREYGPSRRVS